MKQRNLKMNWRTVLLFAAAAGLYTGAVMLIPFLKDTSFQDIGVHYEWWVIFAVLIAANCEKSWEAMLKCFVFFLISQPLVYLVEILAGALSWEQGLHYYLTIWLPVTFLTLPGGFVAFFCKKQKALGAAVLGLGNTVQTVLALAYLGMTVRSFPRHLLSCLVCVGSVIGMTLLLQKEKKNRLIALLLPVVLTALLFAVLKATGRVLF